LEGLNEIQAEAEKAKNAALNGDWANSTMYWSRTQRIVRRKTHSISFYNVHEFRKSRGNLLKSEMQLILDASRSEL